MSDKLTEILCLDEKTSLEHAVQILFLSEQTEGKPLANEAAEELAEKDARIAELEMELKTTARYKMSNGTYCWCEALPKSEVYPDFGHSSLCKSHRAALKGGE